jgi:hypothetical protein
MIYIKTAVIVIFFLLILHTARKEYLKTPKEERGRFWKDTFAGGAGLIVFGLILNYMNVLFFDERLRNAAFFLVVAGMVNVSIYNWKEHMGRSILLLGMAITAGAIYYWFFSAV